MVRLLYGLIGFLFGFIFCTIGIQGYIASLGKTGNKIMHKGKVYKVVEIE
jgi:hypothetical protein